MRWKGTLMTADLAIFPPLVVERRSAAVGARYLHPAALPRWRVLLGLRWQERLELVTAFSLAYMTPGKPPTTRAAARTHAVRLDGGLAPPCTQRAPNGSRRPRVAPGLPGCKG